MLKVLEIADLPDVGQVQLCLKIDGQGAGEGHAVPLLPPVAFETRLKPGDHQEIGWYFQHYLERPFGDAKVRAAAVESRLRNLGRSLFELVFNSSEAAKAVYAAAVAEGLSNHELSVISPRLEFLSLPWELLNEPRSGYLAAQLAGISRRSSPELLAPYPDLLPTDQFNVLLVSPSPVSDEGDAPRSMAPVVVKVLESLDVTVELDFLRPPTLAALEEWLAKRPAHYHVVQFDGVTASGPGLVRLEKPDNTADPIPAQRLAGLLAEARVPAVLVNTGDAPSGRKRSDYPERESALVDAGALGPVDSTQDRLKAEATEKDVWAQISAQLVAGGAPLAVTLPHPLPGSAQEHFLRSFYQALARGTTASTAVAVARRSLMNNPHRDSPAGKLPFWDWAIPMVYQSRSYVPIAIEKPPAKPLPVEPQATEAEQKPSIQLPAEGPFGLVGRQREVRRLERLLQQKAAVFLTGTTGVGKTELALGLARWLQKTGERPGGVFYSSFEIGAGLVRVVHEIGTAVAGLDFADLDAAQQRQWALDYLCQQPCLLIWDALEGVAGFPTGAPGLLDADERAELDSFLAQVLKEGKSQVLLVSRREELWISVPHLSMELQGLDRRNRAGAFLRSPGKGID